MCKSDRKVQSTQMKSTLCPVIAIPPLSDFCSSIILQVSAVVLDGASTNLAMIKILSGAKKGAYGLDFDQEDPHEVQPSFANPINPEEKIHFIICPTHQVKRKFVWKCEPEM